MQIKILFSRIFFILQFVFIIVQILYLTRYVYIHWYSISADIAGDLVLAKTLANEGAFFLTHNFWQATELHFLHTQFLMSILFRLTDSFRLVFTFSFLIFIGLIFFVSSVIVFFVTKNKNLIFIPSIISFAPIGEYWFYLFQYQSYIAYVFFVYLFLLLFLVQKKLKNNLLILFPLSVLSFLMGVCGIRYLAHIIGPIVLVFMYDSVVQKEINRKLIIVIVSFILGFLLYNLYIKTHYDIGHFSSFEKASIREIIENFCEIPFGLINVFGNLTNNNSFFGVFRFTVLGIFAVYYLLLTIFSKYFSLLNNQLITLFLICISSILSMLCVLVFTKIGQIWNRPLEPHYLAMSLCYIPILFAVSASFFVKINYKYELIFLVTCFLLVLRLVLADIAISKNEIKTIPSYVQFLSNNEYRYGYCDDYWKASVIYAFTDDKVGAVHVFNPFSSEVSINEFCNRKSFAKPEFIVVTKKDSISPKEFSVGYKKVYEDELLYIVKIDAISELNTSKNPNK